MDDIAGIKVFLTEFYPEGRETYKPPRTDLVGVFTTLEMAEKEIIKIYVDVCEAFWKGADVRWVDKPKGRFLISNDGTFCFGRIRKIELNAEVDRFQATW